jgi:hypothetical protein
MIAIAEMTDLDIIHYNAVRKKILYEKEGNEELEALGGRDGKCNC